MNGIIISAICAFFTLCASSFKKSAIYFFFMKIYNAFSNGWKKSCIVNLLKKQCEDTMNNTVLAKVVNTPFAILGKIGDTAGDFIKNQIENSFFAECARIFMNSALAINTRFWGIMLLSVICVRAVLAKMSVAMIPLAIAAIVMIIFNRNFWDFIKESVIVGFILKICGFKDISMNIYDEKKAAGKSAIIISVLMGAVCAIISLKSYVWALLVPVALTAGTAVLTYPIVGVFCAVAAAPFVPTIILALLCMWTFFSLCIKAICDKKFKWKIDDVGTGLGFFLIFMLISSLFSFAVTHSMMVWGMYLVFIGFYFVIINTIENKEQLVSVLKLFVICGLAVSIYGILQYVFGWNTTNAWIDENMFEEATMRAYSTMENPNVLGEYLLLIVPLAAAFSLNKDASVKEKLFYAAIFMVGALCMVFTQSRGCWLGLILAAAIFITFYNGKLWGLLPVLLLVLPFIIPDTMVDRMMSVGNLEDSSTSYRVYIWRGTFSMLKDFCIGGIGMGEGAFRSVYPLYSFNGIIAPHAHNTFLQLFVEGGICAPVIFVAVMALFLKKMSGLYSAEDKCGQRSLISLAIACGTAGFLLQSMFDYTFYNYRMMAMFFMITALGSAFEFCRRREQNEKNN